MGKHLRDMQETDSPILSFPTIKAPDGWYEYLANVSKMRDALLEVFSCSEVLDGKIRYTNTNKHANNV